ncbi:hypothetical protein LCGC14_1260800 [marine sediment metagenome]|uniref:Glycosyltransferase 2-like domain-containing protein n=1 Tax=marine sediment metagenome TaxID=412755 RepID=A0A0F9NHE6_9ZZZZ
MNILITPDIPEWAIGNLTKSIIRHNKGRFNFYMVPVHPRGVPQGLGEVQALIRSGIKFDFWHAQYWNSARQMVEYMPDLKNIPSLLTHHNHCSLKDFDWKDFDMLNEMTDWGVNVLRENHPNVVKIPHGIDLDEYSYIDKLTDDPHVGYVGRVLPWKNLKRMVEVAGKNKYKVVGCGYVDKPDYWATVPKENLDFAGGVGRDTMVSPNMETEVYRKMKCFVMYSTDEKESGTLPLLEAMARGIPVLATEQGMARDIIKDGENGIIFDDANFEDRLIMVMEDKSLREKLRKNAWQTIKNFSEERMARNYAKAYYKVLHGDNSVVSVIVPTFNRCDDLLRVLLSIEKQDYPAKEIIVCDDGSSDDTEILVKEAKRKFKTPILYLKTGTKLEYGLAKARNAGAIEALGSILLFMDDRYALQEGALTKIVDTSGDKIFGFGVKVVKGKDSTKKDFMENFAWILKKDFVRAGMFCERMDQYGGLSQETRERFRSQMFNFLRVPEVKADEIIHTPRVKKRDEVWRMKLKLSKMYE